MKVFFTLKKTKNEYQFCKTLTIRLLYFVNMDW